VSVPIIRVPWDAEGIFVDRPNRFLGVVDIIHPDVLMGERVHVRDPGRLKELLYRGNRVLLKRAEGEGRRTKWDLIAARGGDEWVLVHSGYHREISRRILENAEMSPLGPIASLRAEVSVGRSRLDFLVSKADGRDVWVEVKGCTLARSGVALFPDAPTERGRRHLRELIEIRDRGVDAAVMVLVFREAECFAPNAETDPEFASLFREAVDAGVEVHAVRLRYGEDGLLRYAGRIPVCSATSSPRAL
jgi:sugar fermentation stimulation protein A